VNSGLANAHWIPLTVSKNRM